jgi:hypothetical protein
MKRLGQWTHATTLLDAASDALSAATGIVVARARIPYSASEDEVTLDVPGYRQTDSFGCGFVAGLMVLHTFKPRASLDRFHKSVAPNQHEGATPARIIRALGERGISARPRYDLGFAQIRRAIDAGKPIITLVRTTKANTEHWVVVYGYGLRPERVFVAGHGLRSGSGARRWGQYRRESARVGYGLVCS